MPTIEFTVEHQIAWLEINNPERRNALTFEMQDQFNHIVTDLSRQIKPPDLLVIVGTGEKAFAAGGDLHQLKQNTDKHSGKRLASSMRSALDQLTHLSMPVIGAVNGPTAGGGIEILSACDIRIAHPKADLHFAQIRNGLITGWGGTGRLLHLLGQSVTTHLLLTGQKISAHEAVRLGFFHEILDGQSPFKDQVSLWADKFRQLPLRPMRYFKRLFWQNYHQHAADYHQLEMESFISLYGEGDHLEALNAFIEKRSPLFNGI